MPLAFPGAAMPGAPQARHRNPQAVQITQDYAQMPVIAMRRHGSAENDADAGLDALDRMYEYCRGIIARQARRIAELEERAVDGPDGPEYMNTEQVADKLGVSKSLLQQMRARAEGPPFTRIRRAIRYRRADVDEWVATHRVVAGAARCRGR